MPLRPALLIRLGLLALALGVLWLAPLGHSFWRDEALTVVLAREHTFASAWKAASLWSQSPLYTGIEWCIRVAFGSTSEPAMRLPSILAGVVALAIVFRIVSERVDAEAGLLAAALFAVLPNVAAQMPDARPYSFALCARTASILCLMRWTKDPKFGNAIGWALTLALAIYFHLFFAIGLPIDLLFALAASRQRARAFARHFSVSVLLCLVVLSPLVPHVCMLLSESRLLSLNWQPPRRALVWALVPVAVLPALLALVAEWRTARKRLGAADRDLIFYGLLAGALPAIALFVFSRYSGSDWFLDRYLLPEAPAIVLFWASLTRLLQPASVRTAVYAGVIFAGCLNLTAGLRWPDYHNENWRAADASLASGKPLIVYSGLVETRNPKWLKDPERLAYLAAPVLVYRPDLESVRIAVLPFDCKADADLNALIASASEVNVVVRNQFDGDKWLKRLRQDLSASGFHPIRSGNYSDVIAMVFSR